MSSSGTPPPPRSGFSLLSGQRSTNARGGKKAPSSPDRRPVLVVLRMPGNAGGRKKPWFASDAERGNPHVRFDERGLETRPWEPD